MVQNIMVPYESVRFRVSEAGNFDSTDLQLIAKTDWKLIGQHSMLKSFVRQGNMEPGKTKYANNL